jgi:hypothetical protein
MELSNMNTNVMRFRYQLLLSICFLGTQSNCGSEKGRSNLSNITSPDAIEVSILEKFWLYEAHPALAKFLKLPDAEGIQYFPELMPVSSKDYFWVVSSSTNVSLISDPFSRHVEGVISRISFPPASPNRSSTVARNYAKLSFNHELFEGMDQENISYSVCGISSECASQIS